MLYRILTFLGQPMIWIWLKKINGKTNIPKNSGFIVTSNHVSFLDPMIIPMVFEMQFKKQVCYLGKKELFEPKLGKFFHNTVGTIPIDRKGKDKSALKSAIKALKDNKIIGIFPEGGRSRTGKLQKAKTGAVRLAIWSKKPILPIGILGTFDLWPPNKKIFILQKKAILNIGKPIFLSKYYKKPITKKILREATNKVMKEIAYLSNQKYTY